MKLITRMALLPINIIIVLIWSVSLTKKSGMINGKKPQSLHLIPQKTLNDYPKKTQP